MNGENMQVNLLDRIIEKCKEIFEDIKNHPDFDENLWKVASRCPIKHDIIFDFACEENVPLSVVPYGDAYPFEKMTVNNLTLGYAYVLHRYCDYREGDVDSSFNNAFNEILDAYGEMSDHHGKLSFIEKIKYDLLSNPEEKYFFQHLMAEFAEGYERGEKFMSSVSRKGSESPITKILRDIVENYYRGKGVFPTWNEVIKKLMDEENAGRKEVGIHVDEEEESLYWTIDGKEKKLTFHSLQTKLTRIRKSVIKL